MNETEYCAWCEEEIDGDGKWGLCLNCQDKCMRKFIKKIKETQKDLEAYGCKIKWEETK